MDQLAQRLSHERVRQGLSSFDLAERTKIREPYIQALEQARYNVLPAVYVRSFIRTIGTELGIPQGEINRLITQCLDNEDDRGTAPTQRSTSTSTSNAAQNDTDRSDPLATLSEVIGRIRSGLLAGTGRWSARTLMFAAIGVLLTGLLLWLAFGRSGDDQQSGIPAEIVDISSPDDQDSLVLTAVSTDTAELTITIDGTRYQKFIVIPETEYRWSAMKRFTVSNIFNAGAIQFSRNGQALPRYGKRGEVLRELVISRTEVIASNTSTKMITAPADPERARRDSIREQQRRDSIRSVRKKENLRQAQERRDKVKAKSRAKIRPKQVPQRSTPTITKTPPRSVR